MITNSIRWKVPGFYFEDQALLHFLQMCEYSGLPSFAEVYGSIPCKWDGGRTAHHLAPSDPPPNFAQYRNRGVQVYLTFNSNQLTEADLDDEVGNRLLQEGDGAIIASPLLNDYIRDKYPRVSRTASTILSIIARKDRTIEHYQRLCDEYDKVVVGTTHLFNTDKERSLDLKFIDQLDRDKIEIMVNDNCVFDCAFRARHHQLVGRHNKLRTNESMREVVQFFRSFCKAHLAVRGMAPDLILTNPMVATLQEMGFKRFKLVGRDMPVAYILTEMLRYIIPERLQSHFNMGLAHVIHSAVINSFVPVLGGHINRALAMFSQPPAPESQRQVISSFTPLLQTQINQALAIARRTPPIPSKDTQE
ncbi:MAG TPA: hypothetical protein DEB25_00505 [Desulfobulbaceae bacterium]|nr:hypothetical protein [Desulfobulbaceae bacterium]